MGAHTTFTLEDIQSVTGVKTFPTGTLAAVSPSITGTDSGAEILTNKTIVGGLAGIGPSAQVFTSNGTFTIPPGITKLKVIVQGAGGSGAGSNGTTYGSGGAAGGSAIKYLSGLTPGNTLVVTVGLGGVGGTGAGATGGASSVASGTQTITTITAGGGVGGGTASSGALGGGAGGGATGGDINMPGNYGGTTWVTGVGAEGANSNFGGKPTASGGASIAATSYGAGGGGAGNSAGSQNGGNGFAGIVIFEWVN
jgi:hypothetical protein